MLHDGTIDDEFVLDFLRMRLRLLNESRQNCFLAHDSAICQRLVSDKNMRQKNSVNILLSANSKTLSKHDRTQ